MKITSVETYPIQIAYEKKRAYGGTRITHKGITSVIVKIHTDEGVFGVGEASHAPAFGFDTTQEGVQTMIERYLKPLLLGMSPFDMVKIRKKMDDHVKWGVYAKAGVDFALHDLMGKSLDIPTYELLGGCYREEFPLAGAVGFGNVEHSVKEALDSKKRKMRALKILIGSADMKTDIERVRAIREAVGDSLPLRIDANGAYTRSEAIQMIKSVEKYDIQAYEQPLPGWDLDGMAEIRRATTVPLMADESIWSPEDAIHLIKRGSADLFNIKTQKAGGLFKAKKIAAIAESANIYCFASGRPATSIGTAAAMHFVASTMNLCYEGEFHLSLLRLVDDIVKNPLKIENGLMKVPKGPGFGLELDEEKLARYSTEEIQDIHFVPKLE